MPALCIAGTFEGGEHRLCLRMDITFRGGKIAVPGLNERLRVHYLGPTRQARVAERVEREVLQLGKGANLFVLLPESGFFDMASFGWRWKHPFAHRHHFPFFEPRDHPFRQRDSSASICSFPE
jgi:hypothetical protein